MSEPIQNQLEAPPIPPFDGEVVKFESETYAFVHPAQWEVIHLRGFKYGARSTDGMAALFRFVADYLPDVSEEG
ncbi:MAG: hypothetical protein SNJ62_09500, partial [Chloracidobacterium sp.]